MTKEEAINILETNAINATGVLGGLPQTAAEKSSLNQQIEAFDMAITALEKQIPKKPILKDGKSLIHYNKGDEPHELKLEKWQDWVCPECGWFVGQRYNASQSRHHDQRKSNFCNECGQAIDWSEANDKRKEAD